jgi:hypothetical protein
MAKAGRLLGSRFSAVRYPPKRRRRVLPHRCPDAAIIRVRRGRVDLSLLALATALDRWRLTSGTAFGGSAVRSLPRNRPEILDTFRIQPRRAIVG